MARMGVGKCAKSGKKGTNWCQRLKQRGVVPIFKTRRLMEGGKNTKEEMTAYRISPGEMGANESKTPKLPGMEKN